MDEEELKRLGMERLLTIGRWLSEIDPITEKLMREIEEDLNVTDQECLELADA